MLGYETSLNKLEVMNSCHASYYNGVNLEIENKMKFIKLHTPFLKKAFHNEIPIIKQKPRT
jgi:hypothetical protein